LCFPESNEDETVQPLQATDDGGLEHYAGEHDDDERDDGKSYGNESEDDQSDDSVSDHYELHSDATSSDDRHDYSPYLGVLGYRSRTVFQYAALNWGHHFRQSDEMPGPAFDLGQRYLQASGDEIDLSLLIIEGLLYQDIYYLEEFEDNLPLRYWGSLDL
jgi:hypothetical protein